MQTLTAENLSLALAGKLEQFPEDDFGKIVIMDQQITNEFITSAKFSNPLYFVNCIFDHQVQFQFSKFEGAIIFENCHFRKNVSFIRCEILGKTDDQYSVIATDSVFEGSFSMTLCTLDGQFHTKGCTFKNSVSFSICTFKNVFKIYGGLFIKELLIDRCINSESLIIAGGEFKDFVKITPVKIKNLIISDRDLFEFYINEPLVLNTLYFSPAMQPQAHHLHKDVDASIEVIVLNISRLQQAVFEDYSVSKLYITNNLLEGRLVFQELNVEHLIFDKFVNYGNVLLSNTTCPEGAIVWISHSDLGKIQMFNLDFNKFENIYISASSIIGIRGHNVQLPHKICAIDSLLEAKLISENRVDRPMEYHMLANRKGNELNAHTKETEREIYCQLKKVANGQGDRIQEGYYAHKELTSYLNSISIMKVPHIFIVLWLSRITNNMGTNWWLPIIWIFVIGAIIYGCMIAEANVCDYGNNSLTYWAGFWEYLNPTHRVDFLQKISEGICPNHRSSPTFWFGFLDFLGRILNAFLIVQTVTAFRRYIKAGGGDS